MNLRSKYVDAIVSKTEPIGWPLTRAATIAEWQHVVKAMTVRRVHKTRPIHRGKLMSVVMNDLRAAGEAGRIYVDSFFGGYANIGGIMSNLVSDKVIRNGMSEFDTPDGKCQSLCMFRTDYTEEWERLIPVTVKAVLNFLPVTDVLDLLVDFLDDDYES